MHILFWNEIKKTSDDMELFNKFVKNGKYNLIWYSSVFHNWNKMRQKLYNITEKCLLYQVSNGSQKNNNFHVTIIKNN